ncbi:MAG: hypothetical protein HQL32_01730 [Planctomycetes bacterium]|nr:hypothetical protein [Planctomycetota bacterium]
MNNIAFYGGSFNPPTIAHKAIIEHLLQVPSFEKVIVKPCGVRRDKPELRGSEARKKRIIEELSYDTENYHLDLTSLNEDMRPTIIEWNDLCSQYSKNRVYIVCGTDLFSLERWGGCQIERWIEGQTLYKHAYFYIFQRPGSGELKLPPHYEMASEFTPINISSSEQRRKEENQESIDA